MHPDIKSFYNKIYGEFSSDTTPNIYFVDDWKLPLIGIPVAVKSKYYRKLYGYSLLDIKDNDFIYFFDEKPYSEQEMLRFIKLKAFL